MGAGGYFLDSPSAAAGLGPAGAGIVWAEITGARTQANRRRLTLGAKMPPAEGATGKVGNGDFMVARIPGQQSSPGVLLTVDRIRAARHAARNVTV